jgi:hypothetical protein
MPWGAYFPTFCYPVSELLALTACLSLFTKTSATLNSTWNSQVACSPTPTPALSEGSSTRHGSPMSSLLLPPGLMSSPYKWDGIRAFKGPLFLAYWAWNTVSILWIWALDWKRICSYAHACIELNFCNMELRQWQVQRICHPEVKTRP